MATDVYWVEMRPTEGGPQRDREARRRGRYVRYHSTAASMRARVFMNMAAAITRSAMAAVYFSNFSDQRLYVQREGRRAAADHVR